MELGPELDASELPAPVLAVQVTRPAAGGDGSGVVVGVAVHHAVADGHSVWQFMKAWTALSRMEVSQSETVADLAPPAFDRTPIRYPEAEELARKILRVIAPALPVIRSPSSCLPPDRWRRTFLIHAYEIQSVKQHIRAHSQTTGEQPGTHPSTYLAVSSLVWTSIARAKSRDLAGGDAYFLVAVDYRRRLGPPIDERYFGDCIVPCVARAAARDLRDGGGAGLARAAAAIRDAIRAQPECPVRATEAWLESLRTVPRERFTFTGSSNRFMAYETDLGWGAPSRVELVSLFATELVLLLGAAEDGGVQVTATLCREHMEAFASNLVRFSGRGNEASLTR
ncbi:anthocyanidin 3-O-glucoside 6' [Panicum miliaceum]|uniref:Anthocyanidin 3-O-glucoside 6 n=1 Tax=Panicum miliaceum TaxID=4540 RepID=A0A3L6S2N3_PANMI|nr:anthocyanidin 3-O-glucoside 6' [Panicum miliaceum]